MSGNQESAALLRQGRFGAPRTPEPIEGDCQTPSTPRPRFKIKRRHESQHLAAPTQQFLASVAAADMPIPSIEEPAIADLESEAFPPWSDLERMDEDHTPGGLRAPFSRKRLSTPPKTPAPGDPPSLTPSRYPSWSIDWMSSCESSPEPESRPSTSRSTRTSRSSFSQPSSYFSDEDVQYSPDISTSEKLLCFTSGENQVGRLHPQNAPTKSSRKAPWTKAMCAHLWATYNMYLSDPRVTPFQIGKSGIPPEGVCKRVAREASRSWKGFRAVVKLTSTTSAKSGSSTPTADSSPAFIRWPHTGAATCAQLRVLCKQKARGPDGGKMRFSYFSRSPTPFTNTTARWARKSTPSFTISPFETHDMSTSLAMTTSEAMHPAGPLAQLTNSAPDSPIATPPATLNRFSRPNVDVEPSPEDRRRLGSPINAKSYGPSSSASLTNVFGLAAGAGERHTHTVQGPRRRLQSPVRLSRSSTQRKRTRQFHEACKRPGLPTDIWLDPGSAGRIEKRLAHKKSFSLNYGEDNLFASRSQPQLWIDTDSVMSQQQAAVAVPQRLGSPFSFSNSSLSVPNRFSQPGFLDASALGRRFSTVHASGSSHSAEPASINLASKLAYIDQRLKEFNNPRRSESPL